MKFTTLDELRKTKVGSLPINNHLGAVEADKSKSTVAPTLDRANPLRKVGKSGVAIRVSIVVLQRRTMDGDNLQAAIKPLRDAIAASLECDDADKFISWEYSQQLTSGEQGTIVKIEVL